MLLNEVFNQMKSQYLHGKFYGLENGVPTKTILSVAGRYRVFLSFDTTHVFKNFYGNFQTYKNFEFPSFKDGVLNGDLSIRANFNDLQVLYDIEINQPERKAYKLNQKILHPKSIEKLNAQLAVGCFHDSTINALRYYSTRGYPEFEGTADFLQVIRNWFSIFNVKSLYSGQKSRNPFQNPIHKSEDDNLKFLEKFFDWLSLWETSNGKAWRAKGSRSRRFRPGK